ncbi:hypothetical protein G5V59_20165 [Nocardioides sp. W3-2-3]|uniref:hypothetical protein n=1 Tax=Nocardioides convexus TaxID=2712224 RepID=UPI00241852A9|nr:hypothetical protein [Nocardioides convexus]NHA01377.1 hypothetical protein [Nocardioides convexus]
MIGWRDGGGPRANRDTPDAELVQDRLVVDAVAAGEGAGSEAFLVLRGDLGPGWFAQAALGLAAACGHVEGWISGVGIGVSEDLRRLSPYGVIPQLGQLARQQKPPSRLVSAGGFVMRRVERVSRCDIN